MKHTAGIWIAEKQDGNDKSRVIYTLEKPEGIINVYSGSESEGNAMLIVESAHVLNTTGKTPQQLSDQLSAQIKSSEVLIMTNKNLSDRVQELEKLRDRLVNALECRRNWINKGTFKYNGATYRKGINETLAENVLVGMELLAIQDATLNK